MAPIRRSSPSSKPTSKPTRREPKQRRSRQTVDAVLDAVVRLLKRGGIGCVTTNRIAELAGVSIGSVYQYFPNKRAIYAALHDRHVQAISQLIERTLTARAASSLDDFVRALVEALVDAHGVDPELHQLMATELPHGADGARALELRLRGTFRRAISARAETERPPRDLDKVLFVLPHIVESLAHGAAYGRPARLSLTTAKEEAVRAVMAYLRAEA